jgi:hypothetical protein
MKVAINQKAEKFIQKMQSEFAERKIPKENWIEIFSEIILSQPQTFWKEQIEKHTPEKYFLEKALKDPKLSKEITEFLRLKNLSDAPKNHAREIEV